MTDPYTDRPATAHEFLREGDTGPAIDETLQDVDGNAIDLSDADEVRLLIRRKASDDVIYDVPVTIADAAAGQVTHDFDDEVGFVTTAPGMHEFYFEVYYSDDDRESYPRAGAVQLHVPESFAEDQFVLVETDSTTQPVEIVHVQSEADLTGEDEGWYYVEDTDDVVYWIP